MWLTPDTGAGPSLYLNFDWDVSNAPRLPAAVLLLRRQVELVRDGLSGTYAQNFDTLAPVPLAARDRIADATLEFQPSAAGGAAGARPVAASELPVLRAPDAAGFFVLRRGDDVLVRGATHFADPREADFQHAETFVTAPPAEAEALFRRNTQPDPLTLLWLGLIGLALLGSWWPRRRRAADETAAILAT